MIAFIEKTSYYISRRITHPRAFFTSLALLVLSLAFSSLYYLKISQTDNLSWVSWLLAVGFLFYSFLPKQISFRYLFGQIKRVKRHDILLLVFIVILYWASHLWNYPYAPWNEYGLFDDAAWDIYFAKNHAFKSPFQAAFFDEVGYISREVVFHYYITTLFKLFGYNLLVFNISLLLLGFVTVFFTTLLIHKFFNKGTVSFLSAFVINFFPLHYTHIFMGHRYAITAPLMVVSLYFLYTSFTNKSFFRATLSALLAALTWGSSIMGKQYVLGLLVSVILISIFAKKKWKSKSYVAIGFIWVVAFIISAAPLFAYIVFNYDLYVIRERGLLDDFFTLYKTGGFRAIKPYLDQTIELFFTKHTFRRQFLPDFYIIPLAYYLILIPGLLIAFFKKRFELVFLSLIPTASALVSGSYDFRVLLSVPIWVIAMAFPLFYIFNYKNHNGQGVYVGPRLIVLLILIAGLVPSARYLWKVSKNPNHFYLLPHKDVAVARVLQDIVAGNPSPTSRMKKDEFKRSVDLANLSHDTLACPFSSYAIVHLYLQDYDDKKILSFCNQGVQLLKSQEEILNNNKHAIVAYRPQNKDLKLVWEVSDKSESIIEKFAKFRKYGAEETLSGIVDGKPFSLYILTIKKENIKSFQEDLLAAL